MYASFSTSRYRTVSVQGVGRVPVQPDKAEFTVQVQTENVNASQATQQNAQRMSQVMQALGGQSLPNRSIETVDYSTFPISERNSNGQVVQEKTRVSNVVRVTLIGQHEMQSLAKKIDAAVAAGATSISSVEYSLQKTTKESLSSAAREAAVKDAEQKANDYAKAASSRVGAALRIEEPGLQMSSNVSLHSRQLLSSSAADVEIETPIEAPNELWVERRANIVYQLE